MEDQHKVRVWWTGNKSRYDNKVEDVPTHCILKDDMPASVGRSVRVQLDQGGRIWKGVVEDLLSPPSALELALPAKRALSGAKVRYTRAYMYTCIFCKCVINVLYVHTARVHVCCILVVSCIIMRMDASGFGVCNCSGLL